MWQMVTLLMLYQSGRPFFQAQFKCFWKHVVKSWIGVTIHVTCIVKYRIIHVPIWPAQLSAWFLLSGVTVRCTLQSKLSPESLLSLINFGHFFQTNHSIYNKMYLVNGYFFGIPFRIEWYHRLNLPTKYNVRHLRQSALHCDTRLQWRPFFIFLLCHIKSQRMASFSFNTQWFSSLFRSNS